MSVTIPLRSDLPHYSFQAELDGASYGFELRWNATAEGWFLTLSDGTGNVLLSSLRLVTDWPLGKRYKDSRLPPGSLMAYDTTGQSEAPGRDDLGSRVVLSYFTAAELAEE